MAIAVYPGTFDPMTIGHIDIVKRALKIFDKIIVAVAISKEKQTMFSFDDRLDMVKLSLSDEYSRVEIDTFDSLLVDFVNSKGCNTIIRGLRAVSDFEYELQIAYTNRNLDSSIDTICLMSSLEYAFVSSTVVRSIIRHNGNVSKLVSKNILEKIDESFSSRRE
jgi:pantetheine-phosphate adenylyltransferase